MSDPLHLPEDDEAWTALLSSLAPGPPEEPRPYFFARLQARLAAQQPQPPTLPAWLRRSAYAFSVAVLVLALNADTVLYSGR